MRTFADCPRYYSNFDVAPGLEALEKMRSFYTEKKNDIPKDAVSVSGVSLALPESVEQGASLYSPRKEAYVMLKGAVVRGPSLVFITYYEVGVTKIRACQTAKPRLCQRTLGYDANPLYPLTMHREMPCGKEKVSYYTGWEVEAARQLSQKLKDGSWIEFAEVYIKIPERLWSKFEEMYPFFYNKEVPVEAVPKHMLDYLYRTGRSRGDGKSWWERCLQRRCWCTPLCFAGMWTTGR